MRHTFRRHFVPGGARRTRTPRCPIRRRGGQRNRRRNLNSQQSVSTTGFRVGKRRPMLLRNQRFRDDHSGITKAPPQSGTVHTCKALAADIHTRPNTNRPIRHPEYTDTETVTQHQCQFTKRSVFQFHTPRETDNFTNRR